MRPHISWLWGVPIIALAQMIFTFGLSLMLSTLNLFFRDLERFITLGLMLMFYCTPILYSLDLIPEQYRSFVEGNPLSLLIICWRDLFMNGNLDLLYIGELYIYSFAMMLIGGWIFNKLKYRFAEIL